MSDFIERDGLAIVLPKYESIGAVKRVWGLMVFANVSLCRFGVGFQILEAGVILELGPFYFGICHITKQGAAFDRLDAMRAKQVQP